MIRVDLDDLHKDLGNLKAEAKQLGLGWNVAADIQTVINKLNLVHKARRDKDKL